jgi:hemolysin type calcium-binding protein
MGYLGLVRLALLATAAALVLAGSASPAAGAPADVERPACGAPCILFVNFLGSGSGLVASGDARLNCRVSCSISTEYEEHFTLTPAPDSGSVFAGWTGECNSIVGTQCLVTLDLAKTVFPVFDRAGDPPTPLVPPTPPGPPPPPAAEWTPPPGSNPRGCTIYGTAGADTLFGTPGRDVICGLGGNDHVHGGRGAEVLYGDGGNDELEAHTGNDRLIGGSGRDRLVGGFGRDDLRSRDGVRDTVLGGRGRDKARRDKRDRLVGVETSL